jgi:hypothetical protein
VTCLCCLVDQGLSHCINRPCTISLCNDLVTWPEPACLQPFDFVADILRLAASDDAENLHAEIEHDGRELERCRNIQYH